MIDVRQITKTFRSGRGRVTAVAGVTFQLPDGCFAAVVGNSGSGKSTLLNCLGGIDMPEHGAIRCFGQPLAQLSAGQLCRFQRRDLGVVFQRGNLLSYLSVAENIALPLTLNGIGGSAGHRRVAELLAAIGLADAAAALPRELSGGEIQRVSLARAIAHRPRLLLADEPTANLDTATGRRIVQLMRDLGRESRCTVVMATHDREAASAADRIIELRDGQIVREETRCSE